MILFDFLIFGKGEKENDDQDYSCDLMFKVLSS